MTWQTIDSAPKDGTIILLGGGRVFCEQRDCHIHSPQVAAWVTDGTVSAWLIAGTESGYIWIMYDEPTHWQPLPPPPET